MVATTVAFSTTTIAVVGLNAALQKRFVLNEPLVPGAVHRACRISTGIGGKGQDVACALTVFSNDHHQHQHHHHHYKKDDDTTTTTTTPAAAATTIVTANKKNSKNDIHISLLQFIGSGVVGDEIQTMLVDRFGLASSTTIRTISAMRTCTSVIGPDGITTELIEPSGVITGPEFESLLQTIPTMTDHSISAVCFMGSVPPGCPEDAYARIYQRIMENRSLLVVTTTSTTSTITGDSCQLRPLLCVIDSIAGLDILLETVGLSKDPTTTTILKLNVSEFCHFLGFKIFPTDDPKQQVIQQALHKFRQQYHHDIQVALTDGPQYAYLDDGKTLHQFDISPLPNDVTLFPIGAGDAVAAGLIWAWIKEMENPFAFALACGSASCLHEENSLFDPNIAMALYQQRKPASIVS